MNYCIDCHREDSESCPFWDPDFECLYGNGCYLEDQEEQEDTE